MSVSPVSLAFISWEQTFPGLIMGAKVSRFMRVLPRAEIQITSRYKSWLYSCGFSM
jgi:hypothetical protein